MLPFLKIFHKHDYKFYTMSKLCNPKEGGGGREKEIASGENPKQPP